MVAVTGATVTGNTSGAINTEYSYVASYTPTNATAPITYTWSSTGLSSGQGTAIAKYEFTAIGSQTITCTVSNGEGSAADSETLTLCFPPAERREIEIREDIVGILNGITGIGQVHDYVRWSVLYPDARAQTQSTIDGDKRIRVWMVTCISTTAEQTTFRVDGTNNSVAYTYTYKIRGFFGLNDADETEKTALSYALQVIEALHKSDTLHDGQTYTNASLASLDVFEPRMFQNWLAHYIEITQTVVEIVPCLYTGS